jgi:hypothetical protein
VDISIPVLMYHYLVDADTPPTEYYVTMDLFGQQMAAQSAYGYETVTLEDFMNIRSGVATPPAHPVIPTLFMMGMRACLG